MLRTLTYTCDDAASRALAAADPELGALIDRVGRVQASFSGGGFAVIARSIVSQQLSEKAASTIWRRLAEQAGTSPESLAGADFATLRAAGLSGRKIEYLLAIAECTLSGEIDWDALEALDDEPVIDELVQLRGVGRWTAEMYLIFALGRPDVLALDDQGLRNSAGKLMGLGRSATCAELGARGELWRPWRSIASLWLWGDVS
ncbi:MAG: DNA-3-methyladenine glycosylase 2 family protein [Coriobacteriia bacterium]